MGGIRLRATVCLAVIVLVAGCRKESDKPVPIPGATATVEDFGGVSQAFVCQPDGSACQPMKQGAKLESASLWKSSPGAHALLRFDPATTLLLGGDTEVAFDPSARSLDIRRGGATLARAGAGSSGNLRLVVRGEEGVVENDALLSVSVDVHAAEFADLAVDRGTFKLVRAAETLELHAGEMARLASGKAADRRAAWSSRTAAVPLAMERGERAESLEPRGLGRMTARVPGQTAVVSGVRLASHHVRAVVRDGFARTEVTEEFENETSQVLEGRYVFPIPPGASVSRLALWVGDKLMEGEIVERKRAAQIFKGIVDDTVRPRDPALLEWVSGGEFSLKIFPIPAKGRRKVLLAYDQALPADGDRSQYVYPLSLGADRATKIDDFSLRVTVSDTRRPLSAPTTPGYAAKLTTAERVVTASYEAKAFTPATDFVVAYTRGSQTGAELSAYVPKWGELHDQGFDSMRNDAGGGFVALRLGVDLPTEVATPAWVRRDRIIAIDTSQSQSRETLDGERALAIALLRRMGDGERFALLTCDTSCSAFPEQGLAPATEDKVAAANEWLGKAAARGASDVAGAIVAASARADAAVPAQLVYVGDGVPTAGELSVERIAARVLPALSAKKLDLRLLGAGRSLDEVVLTGLAHAVKASYEPISNGEALEERFEHIASDLRRPLLLDAKLELPPEMTEPYPRELPNLRLGREVVVVAKLASAPTGNVKLSGTLDGKPYQLVVPIEWSEAPERQNPLVPRLWASARINQLEAETADKAPKELIELSKRFHVMSRATSLLALENAQMFAEFGIRQSGASQNAEAGAIPSSARGSSLSELDSLEMTSVGALDTGAGPAGGKAGASSGGLAGIGVTGAGDGSASSKPVGTPSGNVSVGGAQVSGGSVANAARMVAGMRAGFRRCYQRGLQLDPSMAGRVVLVIGVGPDGSVASAKPGGVSGNLGSVVSCVVARARAAQFDPPEGGGATISIPIIFKPDPSGPIGLPSPNSFVGGPPPQDTAVHRAGDDKWLTAGEDALEKLRKDLETNKDSRRKHDALVRGLLSRGRFDEALKAAQRFVGLDPDLPTARELLSYAAAASGDRELALAAVAGLVETNPKSAQTQVRAARAFEAAGDEARACAHWQSLAALTPKSDEALFQALRCRARVPGHKDAALTLAKAVDQPGKLVQSLIPLIEAGNVPAYEKSVGGAGSFEATLECDGKAEDCPTVIVVTPSGVVLSPWTPGGSRSSRWSVAFTGLGAGTYRTLIVGGEPGAKGKLTLRALGATGKFPFSGGVRQTVAFTDVTLGRPSRFGWGFGIASLDALR